MELLLKVLPFLRKWIDKEFEKYLRKKFDEQTDVKKDMETLKNLLVIEVEEKQFWKTEVDRAVYSERKNTLDIIEKVIPEVVGSTINGLREQYILIPKNIKTSPYAGMLSSNLAEGIAEIFMRKETHDRQD